MDIKWIGSPYFGYDQGTHGRNGNVPLAIVLHIAEGGMEGIDGWFNSPVNLEENGGSSAHFAIGKDGAIHQYVKEEDAAWGCGQVNKPTWPLLISGVNPNLYCINIEHVGYSGELFTDAMYAADIELISYLCKKWSIPIDRLHITGHNQIDSVNRARCPGAGLNWDRLMDGLKQHSTPVAELTKAMNERMATYPWGDKEALRRGYVPIGGQVQTVVDNIEWFCRLARKPDGNVVLLAFKEGEYTPEQTIEIPFNL